MSAVKAYGEKTGVAAMQSSVKRLPPGRLVESPDTVSLFVELIAAFADDHRVQRSHS